MSRSKAPANGDDSVVMAGAKGRGDVYQALPGDAERGLAVARGIRDPWYRCQSLVLVARHLDDRTRLAVLTEALKAANELHEPNRVVTVASWPLEVLADFGPHDRLRRETALLLTTISAEPHSLRRADALSALLHRVWPVQDVRNMVLQPFRAACLASHGWRRDRLLRYTAQRLAEVDPEAAQDMAAMIEEERIRRRAEREVSEATGSTT